MCPRINKQVKEQSILVNEMEVREDLTSMVVGKKVLFYFIFFLLDSSSSA